MHSPINIGVVGLGRLGALYAYHFASRLPGACLHSVTDVRREACEAVSAATGARAFEDHKSLLADPDLDAVVIMTPTKLHAEVAISAAEAGKAIFCEKPLALDLGESEAIAAAVAKHDVFFHLGFMRRFDNAYAAAWKRIHNGDIGRPLVFKSSSRDQFPPPLDYLRPESSGGLFIDMGIHDFDLARWFMGEVAEVHSAGAAIGDPRIAEVGDVDNAFTTLNFQSGALGLVSLSRNGIYGYAIDTEIVGDEGTLRIGSDRHTDLLVLTKNNVSHDTVPGFLERFEQAYLTQLEDFVANLANGRPAPITCADGIAAQRIALAATRSLHERRNVSPAEI
ncbi:Gfo/Idh/MocA family oxidoreductase [Pelagicoccus sp. NFK12]|uniref:Gfo/Idh/MocA family oxidoreductase n=1 Tax=Pelagicoccus enzymogenes TaxID=2773457 RepID=A0A927IHM9_9BACT|nr:Gfo/Idh/MocA family oxidoreductase [Pelagicoccus enzymogenes]MBD5782457.1 Gfo/Idh/MocA family oxidoreductase [Pelagicoccus enzymogenes]